MTLWNELKRRNVIRVAAAYIVTSWLIIQVAETILPLYDIPESAIRMVVTGLAVFFIPTVILAWVFEWTPEGIRKDTDIDAGEVRISSLPELPANTQPAGVDIIFRIRENNDSGQT